VLVENSLQGIMISQVFRLILFLRTRLWGK
jgi:hypothetical protein